MAYFALLWKAQIIEKCRLKYENEKLNSIITSNTKIPRKTLSQSQRWRIYRFGTQKKITKNLRRWFPEGSSLSNLVIYLKTDQSFPNFLLKSLIGFVGGIVLTYLCFLFFVCQLAISLMHATIMSSIIGVMLTLGLAFSYRLRCLMFLLIPQLFSRVGRYTLTCYALVLILTGPATNTMKNSQVLTESMACAQEQIKINISQMKHMEQQPLSVVKHSLKTMVDNVRKVTDELKDIVIKTGRLVRNLMDVIQSSFIYLNSVTTSCNNNIGSSYQLCERALRKGIEHCKQKFGNDHHKCNVGYLHNYLCLPYMTLDTATASLKYVQSGFVATMKRRLKTLSNRIKAMVFVEFDINQSDSFSSNTSSHCTSQFTAGIVTEIRHKADPLLTWISWSSCVTSLFIVLIISRAKTYQNMFETRSRFDNRYVTKELRDLDLKRQRENRETVLPLNRRERGKYINTMSFRLLATERVHLTRSAMFVAVTSFKLVIHMIADYSLYWLLMTIKFHGSLQNQMADNRKGGVQVVGTGPLAKLIRMIVWSLGLSNKLPSTVSCLPEPNPPDMHRYGQIGLLIFFIWFFVLFEPYGLRLRHVIMGHYQPDRARDRALWLYNHLLRCRGSFLKFARRKLHRRYKCSKENKLMFRTWLMNIIPCRCLRSLLGVSHPRPFCLLCGTVEEKSKPDTKLTKCCTESCPGTYCVCCYTDIGELCTICLEPADYGDLSDISLEKGSSDEDSDVDPRSEKKYCALDYDKKSDDSSDNDCTGFKKSREDILDYLISKNRRKLFSQPVNKISEENIPLLNITNSHEKEEVKYHSSAEDFYYEDFNQTSNELLNNCIEKIYANAKLRNVDIEKAEQNASQYSNTVLPKTIRGFRKKKRTVIHFSARKTRTKFYVVKLLDKTKKILKKFVSKNHKRSRIKYQKPNFSTIRRKTIQFGNKKNLFQRRSKVFFSLRCNDNVTKDKKHPNNVISQYKPLDSIENSNINKCNQFNGFNKPNENKNMQNNNNYGMHNRNEKENNLINEANDKNLPNGSKKFDEDKNKGTKGSLSERRNKNGISRYFFGIKKVWNHLYWIWMNFKLKLNPFKALKNGHCLKKDVNIKSRKRRKRHKHLDEVEHKVEDKAKMVKQENALARDYRIQTYVANYEWESKSIRTKKKENMPEKEGNYLIKTQNNIQKKDLNKNKDFKKENNKLLVEKNKTHFFQFNKNRGSICPSRNVLKDKKKCKEFGTEKNKDKPPREGRGRTGLRIMKAASSSLIKHLYNTSIRADNFCQTSEKNNFITTADKKIDCLPNCQCRGCQHETILDQQECSIQLMAERNNVKKDAQLDDTRDTCTCAIQCCKCTCQDNHKCTNNNEYVFDNIYLEKAPYSDKGPPRNGTIAESCKSGDSTNERLSDVTNKLNVGNVNYSDDNTHLESTDNRLSSFLSYDGWLEDFPQSRFITDQDDFSDEFSDDIPTEVDNTICSIVTIDYNNETRYKERNNRRTRVKTKANRSTSTEKANVCNVTTETSDVWWSPILERKNKAFALKKINGLYNIEENVHGIGLGRIVRNSTKNKGVGTENKFVAFKSTTETLSISNNYADILSPYRYLLESQKYYNELFYPPHFPMLKSKTHPKSVFVPIGKQSSPRITRRNHKAKRLDETYSPRLKWSPRLLNYFPVWKAGNTKVVGKNISPKPYDRKLRPLNKGRRCVGKNKPDISVLYKRHSDTDYSSSKRETREVC